MCRMAPKEKIAVELSHDHKPTRREERERILKNKGKIEKLNYNGQLVGPYRVWADEEGPGIAMTRTLGDFSAKRIGLVSNPEIFHIDLKTGDKFIIIASDGLWNVMSSSEVVNYLLKYPPVDSTANELVAKARERWVRNNKKKLWSNVISDYPTARMGIDDITVVIAYLTFVSDEYMVTALIKSEN